MKRIIKSGFVIASLSFMFSANSQGTPLTGAGNVLTDTETWLEQNKLRSFNENDETLGERFLLNDWRQGIIKTTDGLTLSQVELKYDLLYDMLIGRIRGGTMSLKKNNIENFTIRNEGDVMTFKTYSINGITLYLQTLFQSQKIKLLKKHTVKLVKKDAGNQAYGSGVAYDKYVYKQEYYTQKGVNEIVPLKVTKKSILKLLFEKEDQVKEFIKHNSINVKEEKGLLKVFEFYESIVK